VSYLTLPSGVANFSQAVLSLWFRVPGSSVAARLVQVDGTDPLTYTIPLLVFGTSQMRQNFEYLYGDISDDPAHPFFAFYDWQTVGEPYDVGPSWIGISPNRDGTGTFDLEFNLQLDTYGTYTAIGWVADPPAVTTIEDGVYTHIVTPKDTSPTLAYGPPEFFYVLTGAGSSAPEETRSLNLAPDVWHHLLLSFDLTGELSVGAPFGDSACRMWYAIDDFDYRGPLNLQPYRDELDDLDPNAILTATMHDVSGESPYGGEYFGTPVPDASGNYTPTPVPSSVPFGIPAVTYVQDIFPVEMAEFQLFTGVALDTGVEANRRAFVSDDGKPVAPAEAETLLGVKPEILLHGTGHWQKGINTGPPGVIDPDTGDPIPDPTKSLTPTGRIDSYTPDPSLHGPQGPEAARAG